MVRTPWGKASELRARKLSPGAGVPREEVERIQRERLYGAMVASVAERGYSQTSVAELLEISGVSRRTFYELFADKEECFLATMDEILASVTRVSVAALQERGGSTELAELAVETLIAVVAAQPAAAKLCMVWAFCAGERPRRRIDSALSEFSALVQVGLEQPQREQMPLELTRAILGGIAGVLYRRLADDEAERIAEIGPQLRAWALGIPPPPAPLRARQRRKRMKAGGQPPFAGHVPVERILRGFTAVVAEKGYAGTTIAEVCARAAISQNTFYAHFGDKEAALRAALDSSGAQMTAVVLPAVRREPSWPEVVRVALETVCAFMAAEPEFAKLRAVEVNAAGPEAVRQRDRAAGEILAALSALAEPPSSAPGGLEAEATLAGIGALLYESVRNGGPVDLAEVAPLGTYLALAPSLGAERAHEVACS